MVGQLMMSERFKMRLPFPGREIELPEPEVKLPEFCDDLSRFGLLLAETQTKEEVAECYFTFSAQHGHERHTDHLCTWDLFIKRYGEFRRKEHEPEPVPEPVQSDILLLGED